MSADFKGSDNSPFSFDHSVESFLDLWHGQRREAEPRAPTLNGWNNLVHVVADDAESDILGVLLDHSTQRRLGSCGHHVGFVQNDEFVSLREESACFGKVLDLFSNDVDAAVVRGIELTQCQDVRFSGRKGHIPQESACGSSPRISSLQQREWSRSFQCQVGHRTTYAAAGSSR